MRIMTNFITRLKVQGNIHNTLSETDKFFERLIASARKGILMFKVPLTILQQTDLIRASAIMGKNPMPAWRDVVTNKKVRDEIWKVS